MIPEQSIHEPENKYLSSLAAGEESRVIWYTNCSVLSKTWVRIAILGEINPCTRYLNIISMIAQPDTPFLQRMSVTGKLTIT